MEKETKKSPVKIIAGIIEVLFKCAVAVLLFESVQIGVIYLFYFTGMDYSIYEGLYIAVYSVIEIPLMYGLLKLFGYTEKKQLLKATKPDSGRIIMALIVGAGLLGIVAIYISITRYIGENASDTVNQAVEEYSQAMDRYQYADKDVIPAWDHWINFISTFMLVPMAEELLFRGLVQGEFERKMPPWLAIILASSIFGILHGISVQIGYAVMCGVVLGFVYLFCDSIWASYTVHAVFNFFGASLYSLLESGVINVSEDTLNSVSEWTGTMEIMAILPAVVAFFLLSRIYIHNKKHEQA